MKIVKLEAENVKRLRAVSIEPDGSTVVIRGNNAQGKSSVLDAIAFALGGKSLIPAKVIREGEKEAVVRLDLDGLTIERRWTSNDKSVLEVRAADGTKVTSPQAMLDGLVGRLSFDPLAYLTMPPGKQLEALQKLVGLDFRELDESRKKAYDERTEVNRKVNHATVLLEPLRIFTDIEPVSIAALSEQVATLSQRRAEEQDAGRRLQRLAGEKKEAASRVVRQEKLLADLRAQVERETARYSELAMEAERVEKTDTTALEELANHEIETIGELDSVKSDIRNAEAINEKARKVLERKKLEKTLADHEGESYALTKTIEKIDSKKLAMIEAAKFPVPGLSFSETGVIYNGQPFEQSSQAEKLRVSLGMGLALNPQLKVLLIRDASLLDETNMALVAKMAHDAGAQVWLEVVGKSGVGIVIEDGEVESVEDGAPM